MRKILPLGLLCMALGAVPAFGAHVTPQQALSRLSQSGGAHRAKASGMSEKSCITLDHLYVFENEDGIIILPDDDRAPALLGYCDDTSFAPDENPSFKAWLEFYNKELSTLSQAPEKAFSRASENKVAPAASERPKRAAISPLVSTKWNQSEPYNNLCPELDGERSVTGCVATAMAQIMNYHQWPDKGTGTHSYYWEKGGKELSFDFGSTTFDWGNMLPEYDETASEEQCNAVATLMSACGIAANMAYSPAASGANNAVAARGLIEYLKYDEGARQVLRQYYGLYEWEDLVYEEIQEGRPVYYSGSSDGGGHAFVCDGYSADGFFHINWGWGGYYDGYFLLTALTPAGQGIGGGTPDGYNQAQAAILGLQPKTANSSKSYFLLGEDFYLYNDYQYCHTGDMVQFYAGIYNYSLWDCPEGSMTGVKFTSENGDVQYATAQSYDGFTYLYGYQNLTFYIPSLSPGKYTLTPVYRIENGPWTEVRLQFGKNTSYDLIVSQDGSCEFSIPDTNPGLEVESITYPTTLFTGRQFSLSMTIKNPTEKEFYGEIRPVLFDNTWKIVAQCSDFVMDIMPGETESMENIGCLFTSATDEELEPGKYIFGLVYDTGELMVDRTGYWYLYYDRSDLITLAEAPEETIMEFTGFSLVGENPIKNPGEVTFDYGIKCAEGYFCDNLLIHFYTAGEDSYIHSGVYYYTPLISLQGGEEFNGSVTTDLSSLENGEYYAFLFCGEEYTGGIKLEIEQDVTSVKAPDSEASEDVIYDLYGRRVHGEPVPGLYIRNGRKILVR